MVKDFALFGKVIWSFLCIFMKLHRRLSASLCVIVDIHVNSAMKYITVVTVLTFHTICTTVNNEKCNHSGLNGRTMWRGSRMWRCEHTSMYTYISYLVQQLNTQYAMPMNCNVTFSNCQFTLRHMLASGFSCSTRAGACGSGGGNNGMSTELLTLLPRLLGTLLIPLVVRTPRFLPRLVRVSGSTCTGSGSSTSDSVARWRNNANKGFHPEDRSMAPPTTHFKKIWKWKYNYH
jgi:hypothetical protein